MCTGNTGRETRNGNGKLIMRYLLALAALGILGGDWATAAELRFRPQQIADDLTVGYGVRLVDVNADGKTDIVVVDSDRVVWYQNPDWQMHVILQGQTKRDNVCLA